MGNFVRKLGAGVAVTTAVLVAGQGSAWAFHCNNTAKPVGAGSKGVFIVDESNPDGGTFVASGPGQGRGGFITVDLSAFGAGSYDVFQNGKIDGAVPALSQMNEKNVCNDKGIDSLGCLFGE